MAGDWVLLVLQWVMVLWGLFVVLVTLHTLYWEYTALSQISSIRKAAIHDTYTTVQGTYYYTLIWHRFAVGIASGLVAIGLGAALFYLRRIYLRREGRAA